MINYVAEKTLAPPSTYGSNRISGQQPEEVECSLPGTSQDVSSMYVRAVQMPGSCCALCMPDEGAHHLHRHQNPLSCWLACFLAVVHGSGVCPIAHTVAAARAGTKSKYCPQSNADISKWKPSKAVVVST